MDRRTGSPWRDLPAVFGCWNPVFRRWSEKSVFERIFKELPSDMDFDYVLVDGMIVRVPPKKRNVAKSATALSRAAPAGSAG